MLWKEKSIWKSLKDRYLSSSDVKEEGKSSPDQLRILGEKLKSELLQWGGARDPWIGLKNLGIINEIIDDDNLIKNLIRNNCNSI